MNKENMQKGHKLLNEINDITNVIEALKIMQNCIDDGEGVYLRVHSAHGVTIPSSVALQWLNEEKPRLEIKLKQLEKKFEEL